MKKLLSLALGTMFLVASPFGNLVSANGIEDACDSTVAENNHCMLFDGNLVDVGNSNVLTPSSEISIMAWSRPSQMKDGQMVATKGSHVNYVERTFQLMGPQNNGLWRSSLHIAGPGEVYVSSTDEASLNMWTHTCMTYDGLKLRFFVNGILNDEVDAVGAIHQTGNPLYFGDQLFYASSDYKFYGEIDEVQIWDKALSIDELRQLMGCPPQNPTDGLIGCWNFEEGAGDIVYDLSGNGNHGQVNGAIWSAETHDHLCLECTDQDACDSTCPLVWNQALVDQSVQCAEDLPTSCDDYLNFSGIENLSAINACSSEAFPVFACFPLASESVSAPVTSCLATTAKRDSELAPDEYAATDGAIRLYGLSAMGMADSDYFVEDASNPLQFLHAPDSRSARLTGTVHCVANVNQIFHVDARFVNEDNAMEWLAESDAHTLLIGDDPNQSGYQTCDVDTAGISVFDLQALSRLEGDGELEGTLFIDHMPMSYSKRFQLGLGANNHNCNEGFGGWFRWEGMLNGQSVQGLSGDVVLDLECSVPDSECSQYASFLFEALDDCGRILSTTVTVDRDDTQSPEVISGPESLEVECDMVPPMAPATSIVAQDNCLGDLEVSEGIETRFDGDCPHRYILDRRWTVTDECGNAKTHVQTIQVLDSTGPVIEAESDIEIACQDYDGEELFASATDNCGMVTLTWVDSDQSGGCVLPIGRISRVYTAVDECGNMTTASQILTLTDDVAPEFTFVPEHASYECSEEIEYVDAEAMDNCSGATVTVAVDTVFSVLCMQTFTITRTFTAIDNCDNEAYAVQVIEVADTTAPSLEIPEDYEAECSADHPLEAASASDNCGPVTIDLVADTVAGACAQSYVVTRTFVATDACGNSTSDAQVITIVDTQEPMFVEALPASLEVECDNVPDGAVLTAMDNCQDVSVSYSETRLDGSCPSNYTLTRTWTSSDDCGNEVTHEQVVSVSDTTAPEFTFVPTDYIAECDEDHPMEMATAMDVCSDFEIGVTEVVSYDCPQGYTIERTFEALDACGNSASAMQTITIVDSTPPTIEAVEVVMIPCGEYDAEENFASATDNCGAVQLTWVDGQGSGGCVLPIGQYVRVYTAIDECGNVSTADQVLTLVDDAPPVFTNIPSDYTAECIDVLVYDEAEAVDDCSGVEIAYSVDTIHSNCEATFEIVRKWVATDNCGNSDTAVQVISVVDEEGPYFTFVPEDYTAECSDDLVLEMAEAVDHCSSFEIVVQTDTLEGPCSGQYVILREFVATDACGNASETTQIIFVEDTTAPMFTFVPEDYTAECSDEQPMLDAEAMDACGAVDIVLDESTDYNGCSASYTLTRVWTATDDCGNSASALQIITIEDTTAPVFDMVPESYDLECLSEPVYDDVLATDNCSGVELILAVDTVFSDCENVYDIVRSWTATDLCGNASVVSQTISFVDTTAPQLTNTCGLMNHEVVEVCCETLDGTLTIPAACEVQFTDNCGGEASVELAETYSGAFAPTAEIDRFCVISDPQALANGETCDGDAPTSMELFNFPGAEAYLTLNGAVAHMVDGTMTYTMELVAIDNPNAGWTVEAHYSAPMDWEAWTAQPGTHSFKSDCGLGDHTAWDYAMMTSGFAEGWGDYEGDSFQMMHQPANGYFGFQIGEGANNKNNNYGFSGWFYLSGTVGGQNVMASGDLFGELDCCQPWTLERQYTVTDCVGNATSFSYELQVTGSSCDATEEGGISEGEDAAPVSFKDMIEVVALQPNPASTQVNLTLLSAEVGTDVKVELHASTGEVVMTLFNGMLVEGISTPIDFNVASLNAGLYQLRVTAKNFVSTKKLLVIH